MKKLRAHSVTSNFILTRNQTTVPETSYCTMCIAQWTLSFLVLNLQFIGLWLTISSTRYYSTKSKKCFTIFWQGLVLKFDPSGFCVLVRAVDNGCDVAVPGHWNATTLQTCSECNEFYWDLVTMKWHRAISFMLLMNWVMFREIGRRFNWQKMLVVFLTTFPSSKMLWSKIRG